MYKQIFIINGSGGAGKDSFVKFVSDIAPHTAANFSSVDKIKTVAKDLGWDGGKNDKDRKFLSDLKAICTEYNDLPFRTLLKRVYDFHTDKTAMLFLHIREPKEIERAKVAFNAKTILIKRPDMEIITSNTSDACVNDYKYDIVINNSNTLKDLERVAAAFVVDFLNDDIKAEY